MYRQTISLLYRGRGDRGKGSSFCAVRTNESVLSLLWSRGEGRGGKEGFLWRREGEAIEVHVGRKEWGREMRKAPMESRERIIYEDHGRGKGEGGKLKGDLWRGVCRGMGIMVYKEERVLRTCVCCKIEVGSEGWGWEKMGHLDRRWERGTARVR